MTTRQSLHAVAEHVMATATYSAIGRIGLRPHTGGFATQEFDGRRLVVRDGLLDDTPIDGATLAELGATRTPLPYTPTTPFDDRPLSVDVASCIALGNWYGLVAAALHVIAPPHASPQQIWPEHFDLATDFASVTYGGSPGDDTYPEPYLYVGPWDRTDASSFDDPWGWTLRASQISTVDDAIEFFSKHVP